MAQAEEGLNIKHDISINVSRIPEFVAETNALLLERFPGARMVVYGHLGDGNLHYSVQAPENEDQARFLNEKEVPMNALVYEAVDRYRGRSRPSMASAASKWTRCPSTNRPWRWT